MQGGLRRLLGLAVAGTAAGSAQAAPTLNQKRVQPVATFNTQQAQLQGGVSPQDGQLRSLVNRTSTPLQLSQDDRKYGIPGLEYDTPKPMKAPRKLPKLQQY